MGLRRIGLATYGKLPSLAPDDRLVLQALQRRGHEARAVVWDDPKIRWEDFDAVVIRSCWDYHRRVKQFVAWADKVGDGTVLLNPARVVAWNVDKRYLVRFFDEGEKVVPTLVLRGSAAAVMRNRGWEKAVAKPIVSASAEGLRLFESPSDADAAVLEGDWLLQPYVPDVARNGEWALIFLGGSFSHAVRKIPRAGDFRVQKEHGGRVEPTQPPLHVLRTATDLVERRAASCAYARVDGVAVDGEFRLMELELVEPDLFLSTASEAPARFADAILALVKDAQS